MLRERIWLLYACRGVSPHLVPHLNDKGTCEPCRACHGTYLYIYLTRERYVHNKGTCQQRVAPCRPVSPRVPPVFPLCCPLLCKLCCGKDIHARCFLSRSIFVSKASVLCLRHPILGLAGGFLLSTLQTYLQLSRSCVNINSCKYPVRIVEEHLSWLGSLEMIWSAVYPALRRSRLCQALRVSTAPLDDIFPLTYLNPQPVMDPCEPLNP